MATEIIIIHIDTMWSLAERQRVINEELQKQAPDCEIINIAAMKEEDTTVMMYLTIRKAPEAYRSRPTRENALNLPSETGNGFWGTNGGLGGGDGLRTYTST